MWKESRLSEMALRFGVLNHHDQSIPQSPIRVEDTLQKDLKLEQVVTPHSPIWLASPSLGDATQEILRSSTCRSVDLWQEACSQDPGFLVDQGIS